jgi:hypothetical protein
VRGLELEHRSTSNCAPDSPSPRSECPDQFAGGQQLGVASVRGREYTTPRASLQFGLDGRLYTDLSKLEPTNLVHAREAFYIRTRYPDLLVPENPWRISYSVLPGRRSICSWTISCDGRRPRHAAHGMQRQYAQRELRPAQQCRLDRHSLLDAIDQFEIPAGATRLLVSGFDQYSQACQTLHAGRAAGYSVSTSSNAPAHFWRPS